MWRSWRARRRGEFDWLHTPDIIEEYTEKLLKLGVPNAKITRLLALLQVGGIQVEIAFFHFRHYPADADDTVFLLAALNGNASHLVTYDGHLQDVGVFYPEFVTCEPVEFLQVLRP